jgi:hypothetical protein
MFSTIEWAKIGLLYFFNRYYISTQMIRVASTNKIILFSFFMLYQKYTLNVPSGINPI